MVGVIVEGSCPICVLVDDPSLSSASKPSFSSVMMSIIILVAILKGFASPLSLTAQHTMTYRARNRSVLEMVVAVGFVSFLFGFILVLCVGNYLRAKRAATRQEERRLVGANSMGIPNTLSTTKGEGGLVDESSGRGSSGRE